MVAHYGEQFHHNNPSKLTDQLYLSAARALSSSVLRDLGITCVINATIEMPTVAYQKQECMQIAVEDTISSKLYVYFDLVADKINSVHRKGGIMIIYCRAGMSRSAALCIAYFMKYHGMTVDDAFQYVRERRPIIHPNTGFMRQLRDYEKKLRTKRSQPNIHRVGDPLVQGQPMPDLVYGSETSEDNPDRQPETSEIKPRPKPRIPKFKPTEIRLCCAEVLLVQTFIHEHPKDPKDLPPLPPSKKFKRSRRVVPSSARPVSPTMSNSARATISVAEFSNIAEVRCDTPLIDPGVIPLQSSGASTTWSPSSSFKKRLPFTKITEPAKIAVSFFVIPLCSSSPCLNIDIQNLTNRGLCSVFTADEDCQLAQVSQEVLLECAVGGLAKALTSFVTERVTPLTVTLEANITVVTATATVFECPGVYQYQKMDTLLTLPSHQQHTSTASQQPRSFPARLTRNSATRMSLKIPGLNIRPAPEKHNKRPQLIDPDYFSVATCLLPAVLFEKTTANIGRFRHQEPLSGATVILYSPNFMSAISSQAVVLETTPVFIKSINLIALSTVPSRKLVMTSHFVASNNNPCVLWSEKDMPIFVLPSREYPYYARVPRKESEALEKAKFAATVESTWFFPLKARPSTKAVRLAKSEGSVFAAIPEMPALQWAAERSEFDIDTQWREARPLYNEVEAKQQAKKVAIYVERNACEIEEQFKATSALTLAKYVAPEAYNSWSVMRMCNYPMYGIVSSNKETILTMNNFYSEPRPYSTRANVLSSDGRIVEGFVAVLYEVNVCRDSVELVDIPDVVGDISDIKSKLVNQNDPAKLAIWLEVFKRSVLRARPVHPFVVLCESLPAATASEVEQLYENVTEFKANEKPFKTSLLEEKIPMAIGRLVLVHAVVVTQSVDSEDPYLQETTDIYFDNRALVANKQKASEVRDYIRDYVESRWSQPLENVHNFSDESSSVLTNNLAVFAQSVLVEPIGGVASIDGQVCQAEVANYAYHPTHHHRLPFSVVTRLKSTAEMYCETCLVGEKPIPSYQFVQDVEEEATCITYDPLSNYERLDQISHPVDVLWFFQMETPTVCRPSNGQGSDQTEVDGASGGSEPYVHYSLFLPDPDSMDRLGSVPAESVMEAFKDDSTKNETANSEILDLNPTSVVPNEQRIDTTDLVQGSVKARRHRTYDKRLTVGFDELPPTVRRISPQPITRLPSGLMSYQRPAVSVTRSRSGRRPRDNSAAANDRKTIAELEHSVRSASDLLERRRIAKVSSSTYPSTYSAYSTSYSTTEPTRERERGREVKRTSYTRSTLGSMPNSATSDESSTSLRGLLSFAQSWLTTHKSRREISMERSSQLLRRSKHL